MENAAFLAYLKERLADSTAQQYYRVWRRLMSEARLPDNASPEAAATWAKAHAPGQATHARAVWAEWLMYEAALALLGGAKAPTEDAALAELRGIISSAASMLATHGRVRRSTARMYGSLTLTAVRRGGFEAESLARYAKESGASYLSALRRVWPTVVVMARARGSKLALPPIEALEAVWRRSDAPAPKPNMSTVLFVAALTELQTLTDLRATDFARMTWNHVEWTPGGAEIALPDYTATVSLDEHGARALWALWARAMPSEDTAPLVPDEPGTATPMSAHAIRTWIRSTALPAPSHELLAKATWPPLAGAPWEAALAAAEPEPETETPPAQSAQEAVEAMLREREEQDDEDDFFDL